jgi:Rrf2 family protein
VFSHTVEYALRATLYIARQQPRPVRLSEVAEAVDAPPRYLAKILGKLARAGLLESSRGRTGGFRTVAGRQRTTFAEIAAVFEPSNPPRCLLGSGVCGSRPTCAVHDRWSPIASSMNDFFRSTTIADLLSTRSPS